MNEEILLGIERKSDIENLLEKLAIINGKPIKPKGKKTKNMIVRDIFTGHLHDVEHDKSNGKYYVKSQSGSIYQVYREADFEDTFASPWTRKYVIERECEE